MHRSIIGFDPAIRGQLAGLLAVVILGAILAARPATPAAADPTVEAERRAALQQAVDRAERIVGDLIRQLQVAIDAGRSGAAMIVDGDRDPGPGFEAAADAVRSAAPLGVAATVATDEVNGILAAVAPELGQVPPGPDAAMIGIARQLNDTGQVAGPFIERRLAADATLAALAHALQALEREEPRAALAALDRAETSHATVADWPQPPRVLPFWLDTTRDMIDAARGIARATLSNDPRAAARSVRAYRRAANEARRADIALALAVSEVGGSLPTTPLRRLADAMAAAVAQQQALLNISQASG